MQRPMTKTQLLRELCLPDDDDESFALLEEFEKGIRELLAEAVREQLEALQQRAETAERESGQRLAAQRATAGDLDLVAAALDVAEVERDAQAEQIDRLRAAIRKVQPYLAMFPHPSPRYDDACEALDAALAAEPAATASRERSCPECYGAWMQGEPEYHRNNCPKEPPPDAREAEIARLRKALEHYAEVREYNPVTGDPPGSMPPIVFDKGATARVALGQPDPRAAQEPAASPEPVRRPWCETCGAQVREVLCPACSDWWLQNGPQNQDPPPEARDAVVEAARCAVADWLADDGPVAARTNLAMARLNETLRAVQEPAASQPAGSGD